MPVITTISKPHSI